jgi:L-alanine-DL-glutamate epimerase-like enolase superfamily enzyme
VEAGRARASPSIGYDAGSSRQHTKGDGRPGRGPIRASTGARHADHPDRDDQLAEHPTLFFVRVHTSDGLIGHGETKYAIDALHGFVHQYAAPLLLGKDPLQIDRHWRTIYENAARCGAKGVEVRGLSALDIALWDILGQAAGMPVYQLLGGASHDRMPVYNTCAGPVYARSLDRAKGVGEGGTLEDLDAFTHRADELAQDLLAEGIRGMKIWPLDPYAADTRGQRISLEDLDRGLEPFGRSAGRRQPDGDHGRGPRALVAAGGAADRRRGRRVRPVLDRGPHAAGIGEHPGRAASLDPDADARQRDADDAVRVPARSSMPGPRTSS